MKTDWRVSQRVHYSAGRQRGAIVKFNQLGGTMTDRYGFNRRRFLQGSAAVAGGLMLPASLLSACGDDNVSGSALTLARPDRPVTLPTAANPIAGGLAHEGGTLQILNWVDYLNPDTLARFEELYGVKTAVTTYDTEEIALNKLRSGAFQPDLIIGLTDLSLIHI